MRTALWRLSVLSLLLMVALSTCSATRSTKGLILGPLLQMTEDGQLVVVWWTDAQGTAEVRLETTPPATIAATSREWQTKASPPLNRAWQHVAVLPRLPAGTQVAYRLLLNGSDLRPDAPFILHTPPLSPPMQLAIIGDFGAGTDWEKEVHDVIAAHLPDVLLTVGDNAYDRGRYDEFRKRVFAVYGDIMARIPFMPAIGNHDNYTEHARPYLNFFVLPENAWRPQDRERYYSFDVANVHIVVLDTTDPLYGISDLALDDMADWLRADLAATNKPWRIVLFHHPPYSAGRHGSNRLARQSLVPILEEYNVQFVFSGHEHDYQRTCPIRGNKCVSPEEGIIYVVTGGGGAWLRPTGEDWFTARALSEHEVAFLTLERCQARLEVRDRAGNIIDTFALSRCNTYYLPWQTTWTVTPALCRAADAFICVE